MQIQITSTDVPNVPVPIDPKWGKEGDDWDWTGGEEDGEEEHPKETDPCNEGEHVGDSGGGEEVPVPDAAIDA